MSMQLQLQLVFVVTSVLTFAYVLNRIRKHKMNIDDSIIWLVWSFVLLIFSLFPGVSFKISEMLGFQSASNFIICLFLFFIYIIVFYQSIKISSLQEKNKELVQKMSIYAYEKDKEEKEQKDKGL